MALLQIVAISSNQTSWLCAQNPPVAPPANMAVVIVAAVVALIAA